MLSTKQGGDRHSQSQECLSTLNVQYTKLSGATDICRVHQPDVHCVLSVDRFPWMLQTSNGVSNVKNDLFRATLSNAWGLLHCNVIYYYCFSFYYY